MLPIPKMTQVHNKLLKGFIHVLAVAVCLVSLPAKAEAEKGTRLQLGVVGSVDPAERFPHTDLLGFKQSQDLFFNIAGKPRDRAFIEHSLAGLDFGLKEIMDQRLLREDNGLYYINFTFLTQQDQALIYSVSEKYAASLSQAFQARSEDIDSLVKAYKGFNVSKEYLAYILIGAFSLDWDGLELTEEMQLRISGTHGSSGFRYTPWALENGDSVSLEGIYWGSHNEPLPDTGYTLTTFGDHFSLPRMGLPDFYWNLYSVLIGSNLPEGIKRPFAMLGYAYMESLLPDCANVMIELKTNSLTIEDIEKKFGWDSFRTKSLMALLKNIQYVVNTGDTYTAAIPVLTADDAEMVQGVIRLGRDVMTLWLQENYKNMEKDLIQLTPTRQGVPFEIVFTQVWHFVFGLANRKMVRSGLFADPYAADRTYKGFLPVVREASL